jgi:hypothetical protein
MLGQRLPAIASVPGVEDLAARCAEVDSRKVGLAHGLFMITTWMSKRYGRWEFISQARKTGRILLRSAS